MVVPFARRMIEAAVAGAQRMVEEARLARRPLARSRPAIAGIFFWGSRSMRSRILWNHSLVSSRVCRLSDRFSRLQSFLKTLATLRGFRVFRFVFKDDFIEQQTGLVPGFRV
jgi:hypothetical protein